jgi:hypothetical protein
MLVHADGHMGDENPPKGTLVYNPRAFGWFRLGETWERLSDQEVEELREQGLLKDGVHE